MSQPDWYSHWRHDAVHELIAKNDQVNGQFNILQWPRWDYDMDRCALTFSGRDGPKVVADVLLVGSTSTELKNWQWGWANNYWPKQVITGVDAVRAFGEKHGIAELTQGWVDSPEDLNRLGWELSAVAARVLNGIGVYRPETENGAIFFLYRNLRFLT